MVLWWIANIVALIVVVPLVVLLANRVIGPAREIRRYADDILVHGVGLAGALDPVPALATTAELIGKGVGAAGGYVGALERKLFTGGS